MIYVLIINSDDEVTCDLFDTETKRDKAYQDYLDFSECKNEDELNELEIYTHRLTEHVK